MATPSRSRWSRAAAEAALVMAALGLAFAAGVAGFILGRESADDDDGAEVVATTTAETEAATTETETAETETAETETEGEADGAAVFAEAGCGSCHTFGPANSTGTVGPSLDETQLNKDDIEQQVRNGGGGMPPFEGRLSDEQIEQVAEFVASG